METRFDNTEMWITGDGCNVQITRMETTHLMNIIKMFIRRPQTIMSMLIMDFENLAVCCSIDTWSPNQNTTENVVKKSINTVTSMTAESLTGYAINSPLGQAILSELNNTSFPKT